MKKWPEVRSKLVNKILKSKYKGLFLDNIQKERSNQLQEKIIIKRV